MTDYTKLVEALRFCFTPAGKGCGYCPAYGDTQPCRIGLDAADAIEKLQADAIEKLQAEVQFYDALAEEWKSLAENKERLLGLYRAEQAKRFYSATDDNGRVIQNQCACMNIPVFPDSSEIPNS